MGDSERAGHATSGVPAILVVDEDDAELERVRHLGPGIGGRLVTTRGAAEAVAAAQQQLFDAALIDAGLGGEGALPLVGALRALPGCAGLPIAFFSSDGDLDRRVAATHAGASMFLLRPLDGTTVGDAIRQLTSARHADQPSVLVIDDDAVFARHVAAVLGAEGIAVRSVDRASLVLPALEERRPDLVLLAVVLPGAGGLDLCRMLRASPHFRDLPILMVTSHDLAAQRVAAFEAGADDFLSKPVVAQELLARVKLRIERDLMRRERAEKDSLTGLFLRASLVERTEALLAAARRDGGTLHVCLLDLDCFKEVNDVHGHFVGDGVLAAMGALLAARFRMHDVRGRWGGDEFALVFGDVATATGEAAVKRLLAEFSVIDFQDDEGARFRASFSAGVATFPRDGDSVDGLLRVADRRAFRAKASGRGRVVAAD